MEDKMQKGVPSKTLDKADRYLEDLLVPRFQMNLEAEPSLNFSSLMDADRRALEEFLAVYGGYKAYLECQIADVEARKTSLESYFDDGYYKAGDRMNNEREEKGQKKFTREEVRGAVLDNFPELWDVRQQLIEQEAIYMKVKGLLTSYTSAFNAVSRVVALRTSPLSSHG